MTTARNVPECFIRVFSVALSLSVLFLLPFLGLWIAENVYYFQHPVPDYPAYVHQGDDLGAGLVMVAVFSTGIVLAVLGFFPLYLLFFKRLYKSLRGTDNVGTGQ